jgi:hypothetical protein
MEKICVDGVEYIKASDLARERGVSRQAAYNHIRQGLLPSREFAGARLIRVEDANNWHPELKRGWPSGKSRKGGCEGAKP